MINKLKRIIVLLILGISILNFLMCVFLLTRWYVQNERNKKFISSLSDDVDEIATKENNKDNYVIETYANNIGKNKQNNSKVYSADSSYLNINLESYISKNKETVGWLQVNGTNINYPIVQHKDNDYYLVHDFYDRKTEVGWVFADYRNNMKKLDNNTIIYAHNLINKTMFGQIPNLLKSKWQSNKNNYYIKLLTKEEKSIWKIFSVYEIEPVSDYLQVKFDSLDEYNLFLKKIKGRSQFNFKESVTDMDKIITLSTCNNVGDKRIVVHAKLYSIEKR